MTDHYQGYQPQGPAQVDPRKNPVFVFLGSVGNFNLARRTISTWHNGSPPQVMSPYGKALSWNRATRQVIQTGYRQFDYTKPYSAVLLVNHRDFVSGYEAYFASRDGSNVGWQFGISSNTSTARLVLTSAGVADYNVTGLELNENTWYVVGCSAQHRTASPVGRGYINGALRGTATPGTPITNSGQHQVIFAGNTAGTTDNAHYDCPIALLFPYLLSDEEHMEYAKRIWRIFDQPSIGYSFAPAAGGGSVGITPTTGNLTLLGYAPSLFTPTGITPGVGSLLIDGYAPGVLQNTIRVPGVGDLTLTGYAPGLISGTILTPGNAGLTLTGYAPGVAGAGTLTPENATLTLQGYQPGVTQQLFIVPGVGALTIQGYQPGVAGAGTLVPATASLTLVGYQPGVTQQSFIVPEVGAITVSGLTPAVAQGSIIIPGVGQATFVGYAPSVGQDTVLTPGAAGLIIGGQVPTVLADSGAVSLTPSAGSMGLVGYAPSVLYAVFVDGNGRVWYIPARNTEWALSSRSTKWVVH